MRSGDLCMYQNYNVARSLGIYAIMDVQNVTRNLGIYTISRFPNSI